ncbi:unnamed protein product [Adineta steineri]|uniref:LITAF domain-containing protein n=2 Tax=Adineta steineri TaxID=433720 RepID=A0A813WS29_9BILA|nr:unnamed protein product [Adineta steineri]
MSSAPPPYSEKASSQPAGSYQQRQQQPQPIMYQLPIIVGEYPVQCTCPQCKAQIVTRTEKKVGLFAWLLCGIMVLIAFWICCFIPFCVDACKDTEHYCPSCNTLIGAHKKL